MIAPLKLVHVVRQYAPSIGGLEAVVASLAAEQRRRGHAVRIVTLDRVFGEPRTTLADNAIVDGIPVRRLPWRGSRRYPFCPRVLGSIADADCVHVHGVDFFYDFLALTSWLHRKPLVASTHGGFFHTRFAARVKAAWFHTITRATSLAYRRIVAISDSDGAMFARVAESRVAVIENGVDVDAYRDAASTEPRKVMLHFGRWSSNKGLPALFDLVAALRAVEPGWTLIVAGRPFDLDAADLRALASARDVGDAVEIHEAPTRDALRALMGRASYFAGLSRYEGFGIAAVEAMAAGLYPVLGDIAPFRKLVDAAQCGLLVAPGNEDAAARALVERHRGPIERWTEERAAVRNAAERHDWKRVADRFDAVYADAVRPARTRALPIVAP